MEKELVSIKVFSIGYEVRKEIWKFGPDDDKPTVMNSAYSPEGFYIGNSKRAHRLAKELGIRIWRPRPEGSIVSTGYNPHTRTWYGWSHRAIHGFQIGDLLFEERFVTHDKKPFKECGEKVIETLEEAWQAACNFADYVG